MESANKMNAGSESGLKMSYLITYTNVNGYLIPNLTYKFGEQMEQLGKYGFLRRDYLKNHKNSLYQITLLQDTICLFIVYSKRANGLQFLIVHQLCDCVSGSLITIFSYCSSMFCI